MSRLIIGKIRIAKGTKFTQQYDCAAWYKSMTLDKDVVVEVYGNYKEYRHNEVDLTIGQIEDTRIGYTVNGIVDSSDFTSYFGGNAIGSKVNEEVGNEMKYTSSMYAHSLASSILDGGSKVVLSEEFRARKTYYTWDNEIKNSYGIFNKELDVCGTLMEFFKGRIFSWAKVLENGTVIVVELVESTKEYRIVELIGDVLYELARFDFDTKGWENSNAVRELFLSYK